MRRKKSHYDGAGELRPYRLLFVPPLKKWEKRNNPFALSPFG